MQNVEFKLTSIAPRKHMYRSALHQHIHFKGVRIHKNVHCCDFPGKVSNTSALAACACGHSLTAQRETFGIISRIQGTRFFASPPACAVRVGHPTDVDAQLKIRKHPCMRYRVPQAQ